MNHQLKLLAELSEIDAQVSQLCPGESSLDWITARKNSLSQLMQRREMLACQIAKDLLNLFNKLQIRFRGSAIAQVSDSTCSQCNIQLSTKTLCELSKKMKVVFCENCGRILV